MHNRKDSPRFSWVDILEPVPSAETSEPVSGKLMNQIDLRSCWTRLSFAIADDTSNNKVRLVHDGTKGNTKGITQLSALMDTTGSLGVHMAICIIQEEKEALS
jgi:hypothetical protein